MKKYIIITALMAVGMVQADILSLSGWDDAWIRAGTESNTVQTDWPGSIILKNAGDYSRIGMMKLNLTDIGNTVSSATFSFSAKANATVDWTVNVWAVKDSASGQDWSGATATWDSTAASGLFSPQANLYSASDPNLTLLYAGTVANGDGTNPNRRQDVSNAALVAALNSRLDNDNMTLVFAITESMGAPIAFVRSFDHSTARIRPELEYKVVPEPATLGLIALCSGGLYFKRRFFMD